MAGLPRPNPCPAPTHPHLPAQIKINIKWQAKVGPSFQWQQDVFLASDIANIWKSAQKLQVSCYSLLLPAAASRPRAHTRMLTCCYILLLPPTASSF